MNVHNAHCRMQDAVAVAVGDAVVLVNEMRHSTADKTSPFAAYGPQLLVVFWGGGQQEGLGNACGRGGEFWLWSRLYTKASIPRMPIKSRTAPRGMGAGSDSYEGQQRR